MDKDYICAAQSEIKNWTQIRVTTDLAKLDTLTSIMNMVNNNLMIEDYSDIDLKTCYGDLIDEEILKADKTKASVSVFIPAEESSAESVAFIRDRMAAARLDGKLEIIGLAEEDWANSWKQYYKPLRVGQRIVIVPRWEEYQPEEGDVLVEIDPGMAFGTGTHETTKLVIGLLEKYISPGQSLLDVGCGSGILAIVAAKLGAGICRAYDIDPMAVRVANENIEHNRVGDRVVCGRADLLKGVSEREGGYDIICANIVADIIIRMAPDVGSFMADDGLLLASGIIAERAGDVVAALGGHGLYVDMRVEENGWCAMAFKKNIR